MYMTQGLRRVAKITPDKTALISKNVEFTWAEFLDRVARLAGALHGLAMKTEDRVAMRGRAMLSDFYYRDRFIAICGKCRKGCV